MQLQENTLFANRYALQKLLGRGGFSEVWLAKDNWTHLHIALKVYAPGQGMDSNGLQEFCGELASVYDLNHQNLLKPQHVDTWEDMPYLIMAYCAQGSCAGKLGKMTETKMWKFIRDVASGLAYLHEKDVVHQDIKPDNILIDDAGNYLITDFGVSTRARTTLRKSVVSSSAGGTTAYMGPERFSRQPAPTKASDIWSFGAMCFELLEGAVPFGEIGGGMQKGGAEIPAIQANVSDALKYTITKMLQKETWNRPTAATLVEWAKNPQNIEIDYSLLEDGSAPATPASPTPNAPSKPTQRLNNKRVTANKTTRRLEPQPKEPLKLSVYPSNVQVPAGGGNVVIYVKSNAKSWKVRDLANWAHLDKKQKNSFTLQFDKNYFGKNRECSAQIYASDNGELISVPLTISQTHLSKFHALMNFFLVGAIAVGIAALLFLLSCEWFANCFTHQEQIRMEQECQEKIYQEQLAQIAEEERKAAEERARQAEKKLKEIQSKSSFPVSNGVFQLQSGALLTIPSCFVAHEMFGPDNEFFNADKTMKLFVSSDGFATLQSAYSVWTESDYGISITYQRITDKFAVVSWIEDEEGAYCRADLVKGRVNFWILRWNRNYADKEAKRILNNFEIKFVK